MITSKAGASLRKKKKAKPPSSLTMDELQKHVLNEQMHAKEMQYQDEVMMQDDLD
jgi:hypothetical protein